MTADLETTKNELLAAAKEKGTAPGTLPRGPDESSLSALPDRVILVGFRGSGKSSAGAGLARRLGASFFDTDEWVEKKTKSSISEIFKVHGEAGFRKLESEALEALPSRPTPEVVATGGGAVISPQNRRHLEGLGLVVYLEADPETLTERIRGSQRPSLTETTLDQEVALLVQKRRPYYLDVAHVVLDARPPLEEVVDQLTALWKSLKPQPRKETQKMERSTR